MKIQFFFKESGEVIPESKSDGWLFVMNGKVMCDTFHTYESQAATIGFDDVTKERPDIDWRVG